MVHFNSSNKTIDSFIDYKTIEKPKNTEKDSLIKKFALPVLLGVGIVVGGVIGGAIGAGVGAITFGAVPISLGIIGIGAVIGSAVTITAFAIYKLVKKLLGQEKQSNLNNEIKRETSPSQEKKINLNDEIKQETDPSLNKRFKEIKANFINNINNLENPREDYAKMPEELKKDKEIILALVTKDGQALKKVPQNLKTNIPIVLAAVKNNGKALEHARGAAREDINVNKAAIEKDLKAIKYVRDDLKKNKEILSCIFNSVRQKEDGEYVAKYLEKCNFSKEDPLLQDLDFMAKAYNYYPKLLNLYDSTNSNPEFLSKLIVKLLNPINQDALLQSINNMNIPEDNKKHLGEQVKILKEINNYLNSDIETILDNADPNALNKEIFIAACKRDPNIYPSLDAVYQKDRDIKMAVLFPTYSSQVSDEEIVYVIRSSFIFSEQEVADLELMKAVCTYTSTSTLDYYNSSNLKTPESQGVLKEVIKDIKRRMNFPMGKEDLKTKVNGLKIDQNLKKELLTMI